MIGTSLIGSLDTGLRGAGIALFLLIAIAVLRQGGGRAVAWLGAALSVGAAAYALCSMPDHPRSLWFAPLGIPVERLYRREGLGIGDLAARLGLPEHRLRRVINRGLGFRNFNEYLNSHRLADARQALADPAQRNVPILTIALDAGFQSLSPFNRAFKADTGMTPTEFRRRSEGSGGT